MKSRLIKVIEIPFVRNVTILVTGTATAQAITIAFSPIITRLYGPEAFGLMGAFMAIVGIVAPIAALTYPIAIILPKSDQDAKGLIRLSLIITGIISMISLVILILFDRRIIETFNLNNIAVYLYLIPLVIIFAGMLQVTEQWLIRTKQFSINARVTFLHSLVLNSSKVGVGLFYPVASVLILLSALASGLHAAMMIFFAKNSKYKTKETIKTERKSLKSLAREYYDFPLFRAPQTLLFNISESLPVLLLTGFFGPSAAGFYTLGRSVMIAPSTLIAKSVGDVFYPRISEAVNNGENSTLLLKKSTFALVVIGVIPFGLVMGFGPQIFSFIFGTQWHEAGEFAGWIALFVFFRFIHQPSVRSLPTFSAQGFHLKFTIVNLLLNVLALFIGYHFFSSSIIAIALFAITNSILSIVLIITTLHFSRKQVISG